MRDEEGRHCKLLLLSAIFLLALLPRLWAPSPFITWDEPTWTYRSLKFLAALRAGDGAGTYLTAHPGVVTMWAGALGIAGPMALSPGAGDDLAWVGQLPTFEEDDVALLARLTPWLPPARLPIAVLTALAVVGACRLLHWLVDQRVAFLAGLLLALDPFFLAHSRVLHVDALMAGAMLLSVLSTLVYLQRQETVYLLLGGALGGVAALEKSPALFLVPFTALLVAGASVRRQDLGLSTLWWAMLTLTLWGLAAGVTYLALWPALWVDPGGTLGRMWAYAAQSAGKPREAVFFWGRIQPDPGLGFYPCAILYRLTPLTSLSLVASLPALVRGRRQSRGPLLALLAYAILFTAFMASGAKKFERYILPVLPALDILAAAGLVWLADESLRVLKKREGGRQPSRPLLALAPMLLVALLIQGASILPYHPYYLAYYNPLLGGGAQAVRRLPVGWGEGMDQIAQYLNQKPGRAELRVATPSVTLLAPLLQGHTVRAREWQEADYMVLYVDDVQIRQPDVVTRFYGLQEPEYVVQLHGIEYAWIYRIPQRSFLIRGR